MTLTVNPVIVYAGPVAVSNMGGPDGRISTRGMSRAAPLMLECDGVLARLNLARRGCGRIRGSSKVAVPLF